MAVTNFIPTIWSARLLENLQKRLVYTNITNNDYEGDVKFGNAVKINAIGRVNIFDYAKYTALPDPQVLDSTQQTLLIDQAKAFNFAVDDIDKAQANVNLMDAAMRQAAQDIKDVIDKFIASHYTYAANAIGDDTTPIVPTATTAYELLVDASTKLDEMDIPSDGRVAIVPPWFHGLLRKDDRFVKYTSEGQQVLRTGLVGEAAGFQIFISNNVPNTTGTKYKILCGHPMAITFAQQIEKIEAYRPEKLFADAVKGLVVYGAKVIRPEALVVITANKA
ncbi:hypothetical protein Calow_0833 [Caldicellulosiruptor owensensis OL]|uniref:P22 coat protein-protein 5 domain protein n=1 Tax=Caldicellulosiruptor owensensis (strain ATCC 700167 / DSM 13100 / OL) TaxID=632518 RepID=E4Q627_CALOW|nr:phage capsid protein [Caldicellulosiruptor owensensis]ADQ04401.1 hypothetical protein Calow_0833 [Caldicellulosiruptor owensensis OL]